MPIDDNYWKAPPKPEGGLAEDGTYYVRIGKPEIKTAHNNETELLEIPVTVEEHPDYAGEELQIAFMYYLRGEWKQPALDRMKKISDSVAPGLRERSVSFLKWLDDLNDKLNGRKAKIEQRTAKNGKAYLDLLEVYEAESMAHQVPPPQRPTQPVQRPTQPTRNELPPMQDDIPFH